jgi:hypothetical protein
VSRPPSRLRLIVGLALLAVPVFPIPGLTGRTISVGGVARTDTGGAMVAATVSNGGPGAARLAITRLNVDGTVDLGYGIRGISAPPAGAGSRATALAIDPASGEAWIGVVTGSGASEVVALDGRGNRVKAFGRDGVVTLGAPFDGGARALAWRPGELVVAAGTTPCDGCRLAVVDASSGRIGRTAIASTGDPGCPAAAVTSVVFKPLPGAPSLALVGLSITGPARCDTIGTGFVTEAPGNTAAPMYLYVSQGARSMTLAGTAGDLCVASTSANGTRLGPGAALGSAQPYPFRAPAGRLVGLTTLGGGACAALIYPTGARHAVVVQNGPTGSRTSTSPLPGRLQPLGMSRCNQHLLVIGDEPRNGVLDGVVAVVPVRAGPHASAASPRCTAS